MTKADIVNEIAKTTGIEKTLVLETLEKFMEIVKDSLANDKNIYLRGFRFIYRKDPLAEDCSQHIEEHDHHHSRAQDTGIQARQSVHGRGERLISWQQPTTVLPLPLINY